MSVLDDVNTHRNELRTDSYTTTISDLLSTYSRGDLKINPEYQRLFRWDLQRQSEYIESLLLNIPTPPLFFATNQDGENEVIDGLQRLSTLIKFFAPDVFQGSQVATPENNEENQNNINLGTMLLAAPLVESIEGFTLKTLPDTLVRTLRYTRIPIILLEKESSPRARYHVFKRLNRSGSVLSDQEIRNCTARLYGNKFPEKLRELSKEESIKTALGLSEESFKKMGSEEYMLRLMANAYSQNPLKHSVIEYLDDFMNYASEGKFELTDAIEESIKKTFIFIAVALPDGAAFKFWRNGNAQGSVSANLFDIVATGIYKNIDSIINDHQFVKTKVSELHESGELKELVGSGSNTRKKHVSRLALGENWFKK